MTSEPKAARPRSSGLLGVPSDLPSRGVAPTMVPRQPGSLTVETGEVGPLFIVPDQGLNLAAARAQVFWAATSFYLQLVEQMSLTKAAPHRAT